MPPFPAKISTPELFASFGLILLSNNLLKSLFVAGTACQEGHSQPSNHQSLPLPLLPIYVAWSSSSSMTMNNEHDFAACPL